ncbi:MAG: ABC transporter substrate-binding protein [Rhodospirillaceae bacterium]|nr:ABC transporter substrate-binding protein [Rhodospirillales bacterium]
MRWCRSLIFALVVGHAFPAAAMEADARGFVEQYITETKRIRADTTLAPDQKSAKSRAMLHDAYDFAGAPKAILGRHWAKATEDQQRRYLEQFERYLIAAYGKRFDEVASGLAVTDSSVEDTRTIVHSTSTARQTEPMRIDWVLVQPDGKWRITDVLVNGIGSVETMRQEFSAVLRSNNGDIEGLLSALQQRTEAVRASD